MKKAVFSVCLFAFFVINAQAQTSVPGWTPPAKKAEKAAPSINELAARGEAPLSRLHQELKLESITAYKLPPLSPQAKRQKQGEKRLRIGVSRQLPEPININTTNTSYKVSGGTLRLARIVSEGAVSMRLHLTNIALPKGTRVFVFSAQNPDDFAGPYLSQNTSNDLWTPSLKGDTLVVEYFTPDGLSAETQKTPFVIAELSHIFINARSAAKISDNGKVSLEATTEAEPCELNVPAEWSEAAKSVGLIEFGDGGNEYLCTGTLLNTADNNGTPYFLTANHCINNQASAEFAQVYWLFDNGSEPNPSFRNRGAWLLASGKATDSSLLQLRGTVPAGVRYAGWDATRPTVGTSVTGLHHPAGEYKRISYGSLVNAPCGSLSGQECDNLLKVRWSSGITEPGSSGSAIFTGTASDPRLVGTLLGGDSSCTDRNGIDLYGRFDLFFPAVSRYLTGNGCTYHVSPLENTFDANGGTGNITVIPLEGAQCDWQTTTAASWITIGTGASGAGEGTFTFNIQPNTTASQRTAVISVAGQLVVVTQGGLGNNCEVKPIGSNETINAALGTGCSSIHAPQIKAARYSFQAVKGQQVSITAKSSQFDTFLTLLGPQGEILAINDDFLYGTDSQVPANSSSFTIPADATYTIEVASLEGTGSYSLTLNFSCKLNVTPSTIAVVPGSGGEAETINVRFADNRSYCLWEVRSSTPWVGNYYQGASEYSV
ncbi:MAG TPA: BACON domain-containing carbohydrate-binding protein, partial [Blastocatellia bacterium]|nr:BACON domain-containing carbohydrate-binding protein [Blastocatellia bacterium]